MKTFYDIIARIFALAVIIFIVVAAELHCSRQAVVEVGATEIKK